MSDGRVRRGTIPLNRHLSVLGCVLVVLLLAVCGGGGSGTDVDPRETTPTDTIPLDGRGGGVIAYSKQPGPGGGIHRIFAINANGTGDRQLVEATIGLNHHDWSPDGQRLVVTGYMNQTTWSIHVFDADGTGLVRLTQTAGVEDTEPAWSPDSRQIAFTRMYPAENRRSELWLMNADGTNKANLTSSPADDNFPCWSPDGKSVAFASNRDDNWEIYVMRANGTNQVNLTDNPADDAWPRWSPDGRKIAFFFNSFG